MSHLFPMFLKLAERCCLVVGAGAVAEPKIASLLCTGARVVVVAPTANEKVHQWATKGQIELKVRVFEPADLDGIFLVIAATSCGETNNAIFREASRRAILCNAVDDPEHCDFYCPAVVRRGLLQVAISTGGSSPALAQRLRQELEQQFGAEYELWLEHLARLRRELRTRRMNPERRRGLLHSLASGDAFNEFKHRRTRVAGGQL